MPSPAWRATRSLIAAGTGGEGGTGSPGAPQPAETRKMEKRKCRMRKNCAGRFSMRDLVPVLFSIFQFQQLQDVAAQILGLDDIRELLGNISGITFTFFFLRSGASNEISSRTFSRMV